MTKLEVKFYDPYKNEFLSDLKKSFDTATEVWIATAFFDNKGFELFIGKLTEFLKKGRKLCFLVEITGFYNGGSDPKTLDKLCNLKRRFGKFLQIKYYYNDKSRYILHSKFYFFNGPNPHVFIGSSNLTGAGFDGNIETNVRLSGNLNDFKKFYEYTWSNSKNLTGGIVQEIKNIKEEGGKYGKKSYNAKPNLPPSGPIKRVHPRKKIKRKKGSRKRKLTQGKFEKSINKVVTQIKKERRENDVWPKNTYDQMKKDAKKLLRNPTDTNLREFANQSILTERFRGQFGATVKQFFKRNSKERRIHFARDLLRGNINMLKMTDRSKRGHLSYAGWVFSTLLLHLQDPRRNILSNANKILSGLRKDGKIERGANRVEQYKMFNKWANQVKKAKGLRTCEMDVFLARLGGEI